MDLVLVSSGEIPSQLQRSTGSNQSPAKTRLRGNAHTISSYRIEPGATSRTLFVGGLLPMEEG